LPYFVNFTSEYVSKNFEENGDGLELHGTHQLLVRAGDVTLLAKNINSRQQNTDALLGVVKGYRSEC
jgi:hypothetical protein